MAGYIAEFFGYAASDKSDEALSTAARKNCPFLGNFCVKTLSRDKIISGVCALRQKTPGSDKLPKFPSQPASINFIAYDEIATQEDGVITPLGIVEEHCTTVYKVQEAFSSLNLPEGNVYKEALSRSLYPERYQS